GTFTAALQDKMLPHVEPFIQAAGTYLHSVGYFGVVGIDLLRDTTNQFYLVDVNPRLTGISPFLIASRIFARDGIQHGIYQASCRYDGTLEELISTAAATKNARVLIHSAFEENGETTCHLSVSSNDPALNLDTLDRLLI
ncbi:MAG: ATP-grasp domain-containing protein, partial [Planctomycetaceae bacterium]